MRMGPSLGLAAAIAAVGVSGSVASAANLASDFSITNGNPNGAWTYASAPATAGYTLTPFTTTTTSSSFNYWHNGSGDAVSVGKNTGASFNSGTVNYPAGTVVLHPSSSQLSAVARFTASATDIYSLAATFGRSDGTSNGNGVDVSVVVNGVAVYAAHLDTSGANPTGSYAAPSLPLTAGSTVDFVVGSAGDYTYDATTVAASVNVVPEPATLAAGAAAVGLVLRRRRRA